MEMRKLGKTGIEIAPLVLGGNVFGWTADRETSFAILDAFLDAGFNAIDTADVYNRFAPGLKGGESETLIGDWMHDRGVRGEVVIITKAGLPMGEGLEEGLGADYLQRACEASLRRLRTDRIDVYMAHCADPKTPIADTLDTFGALVAAGKARVTGCSNYGNAQLAEALAASAGRAGGYTVFEPHYSLARRDLYEGEAESLCSAHGVAVIAYYALAAGFLSGKYRSRADFEGKARGSSAAAFFNERSLALLGRLDAVAARHGASCAQVALAWVMARPSVTAPIASATSLTQLRDILAAASLRLTDEDMAELDG